MALSTQEHFDMVMFTNTKAQQIAENGLLSIEGKIAQLRELEACLDASRSRLLCSRLWRLDSLLGTTCARLRRRILVDLGIFIYRLAANTFGLRLDGIC